MPAANLSPTFIFLLTAGASSFILETSTLPGSEFQPARAHVPIDVPALDRFIESARDEWDVPGLGIAIVRNDEIILARGYGKKRFDDPAPVDEHTLFAIGSTTKAFTATAVAMLVDDGLLEWDDPVTDHLSGFVLNSPYLTASLTLRDLLAHRSGLPAVNLMWLSGLHDSRQLIDRLRHLQPVAGLRTSFTYQNLLYLAAGLVIESATGITWSDYVTRAILEPLGMVDTRTGLAALQGATNVATPHIRESGQLRAVPHRDIDAVGPAGSLHSSAADMAQWLRLQLGNGALGGNRLVKEASLAETRSPQILIGSQGPLNAFYPETRMLAYGMGWVLSEYRGYRLVDHAGGIDGMTALVAFAPEAGIGVAILANLQSSAPPYWLLYPLIDILTGTEPRDRTEQFRDLDREFRTAVNTVPDRIEDTAPINSPKDYSGRFVNPALGEAEIRLRDGSPNLEFGRLSAVMVHWHYDTYRLDWTNQAWNAAAGPGWLTFNMNHSGKVDGFNFKALPGDSWTFTRSNRENSGSFQ